jgi:AcrR family transcriptional regulator
VGRRPGAGSATREAILGAARRRFADLGFAGSSVRAVAADADVDPALVLHYFGSKADLFAAAVQLPVVPSEHLDPLEELDPSQLGEAIVRMITGVWEQPEALEAWLGLLRSATSDPRFARMLREFLTQILSERLAALLDTPDLELRLGLAASQIVGLGLARYVVGFEPLASLSTDELVAAVAPTLQRYFTGDLDSGW